MRPINLKAVLTSLTFCVLAWSVDAANAASAAKGQAADAGAIETVFSQYKDALLQGDGAKAADVVSARTIAFYDGIAAHSLNTSRAKLAELDFLSKLMVVRIRHEFTRAQIAEMDGRTLLATGVNKGWISKSSVANIDNLVDIRVDASKASAAIAMAPDVRAFHFVKEAGQWKLDLVAMFGLATDAMKQEVAKSGLTEEQFIVRLLSVLSSTDVDERIFSPPL